MNSKEQSDTVNGDGDHLEAAPETTLKGLGRGRRGEKE